MSRALPVLTVIFGTVALAVCAAFGLVVTVVLPVIQMQRCLCGSIWPWH